MPPWTLRLVVGGGHAACADTSLICVAARAAANESNAITLNHNHTPRQSACPCPSPLSEYPHLASVHLSLLIHPLCLSTDLSVVSFPLLSYGKRVSKSPSGASSGCGGSKAACPFSSADARRSQVKQSCARSVAQCGACSCMPPLVSKTKPNAMVMECYESGHRHFGSTFLTPVLLVLASHACIVRRENYVQEFVKKAPELPSDIRSVQRSLILDA
jgi:hypothetical protein